MPKPSLSQIATNMRAQLAARDRGAVTMPLSGGLTIVLQRVAGR